jgi:predicted nucleic acid-binding protein
VSYLVDASVAFKWFISKEPLHIEAQAFLRRSEGDLHAPEFILAEIANAIWKKQIRREMSRSQANLIVAALPGYIHTLHPTRSLIDRALEIAIDLEHPVYDCIYLACAEITRRILMTDDRRLRQRVAGTPFEALTQSLVDVQ